MRKSKVIVYPLCGLSNRLRVIESGLSLAKALQGPLEVNWIPDEQMVANFSELFIIPVDLFKITKSKYSHVKSTLYPNYYKRMAGKFIDTCYSIDEVISEPDIPALVWTNKIDLKALCKNKVSYFYTSQRFYPSAYNYSWLKPLPVIEEKLLALKQKMAGDMIGIHIRRTDHKTSIIESPDNLFIKAIETELKENDNVQFLLCTDNSETEATFISKFGSDHIFVHPKKFGRDTIEATQDAVVDLLGLSLCKKLYCSYFSSFSETASAISGAPTIICRNNTL